MNGLSRLIDELWSAQDFEAGAKVLLRAVLAQAEQARSQDPGSRSMRILRSMLHLRPGGSYEGLVVLRAEGTRDAAGKGGWLLPSATVWRHVHEHRQAVAVSLLMGTIRLVGSGRNLRWSQPRGDGQGGNDASMQRLLDRDATHLYALPLRSPGGIVQGMISVEMSTRAVTAEMDWSQHAAQLQLLADVATPALMLLPRKSSAQPVGRDPLLPVVGEAMAETVRLLSVFATMEETILVSGPTGAGKSRLAHWCHARSSRSRGPFETVDLNTIPEQTQMAELFGWKRGAFTGAVGDQAGHVARASGGTLFIDEIDKLSMKAQAGLLQLLESRSYRPLGSNAGPVPANLRFVVGTNADLPAAIREGRFREDLYYRINVLPVRLPPLAERKDEIADWARFMLERRHKELKQPGRASFSEAAVARLCQAAWPGNLRQLDNAVRRAYAMGLAMQAPGSDLLIGEAPVAQALAFEVGTTAQSGDSSDLMSAIDRAAEHFVALAQDRQERGGKLDLDHSAALRGAVLRQALAVTGDLKLTYELFGRHAVVASRNHTRDYRRELGRLQDLEEECEG